MPLKISNFTHWMTRSSQTTQLPDQFRQTGGAGTQVGIDVSPRRRAGAGHVFGLLAVGDALGIGQGIKFSTVRDGAATLGIQLALSAVRPMSCPRTLLASSRRCKKSRTLPVSSSLPGCVQHAGCTRSMRGRASFWFCAGQRGLWRDGDQGTPTKPRSLPRTLSLRWHGRSGVLPPGDARAGKQDRRDVAQPEATQQSAPLMLCQHR